MKIRKKWPIAMLAALALAVIGVTAGMAASGNSLQQLVGAEASAVPSPSTVSGKSIKAVKVVRNAVPVTTQSTAFADVPGAKTTIRVPDGQRALILARFSAESLCTDSTNAFKGWCGLRIYIGNAEGEPSDASDLGTPYAFDSDSSDATAGGGSEDWYEGNSMDRSRVVGAGLYTVKVQAAVLDPSIFFWLDDMSLTVEQVAK